MSLVLSRFIDNRNKFKYIGLIFKIIQNNGLEFNRKDQNVCVKNIFYFIWMILGIFIVRNMRYVSI